MTEPSADKPVVERTFYADGTDTVSIDRDNLGIVLEYAYRGIGSCLNYRDPECPLCQALNEAEIAVRGRMASYAERNWFTHRGLDRLRRWREIRKWGKEDV